MGHAVVLQHDELFHLLEMPMVRPVAMRRWAPQVRVGVVADHLAVPVHALDDLAGRGTQLHIFPGQGAARRQSRTERRRLDLGDLGKYACVSSGPIENDERDGSLQHQSTSIKNALTRISNRPKMP